jgi:hypothetical protein
MTRRTKRLWTDEEKRSICLQTTAPSVSVAQVAQRYAMNANLSVAPPPSRGRGLKQRLARCPLRGGEA